MIGGDEVEIQEFERFPSVGFKHLNRSVLARRAIIVFNFWCRLAKHPSGQRGYYRTDRGLPSQWRIARYVPDSMSSGRRQVRRNTRREQADECFKFKPKDHSIGQVVPGSTHLWPSQAANERTNDQSVRECSVYGCRTGGEYTGELNSGPRASSLFSLSVSVSPPLLWVTELTTHTL